MKNLEPLWMLEAFGVPVRWSNAPALHRIWDKAKSRQGAKQLHLLFELLHITILCESPVDKAQENPKQHPTTSQHLNKFMSITLTSWQYLLKQTYVSQSDIQATAASSLRLVVNTLNISHHLGSVGLYCRNAASRIRYKQYLRFTLCIRHLLLHPK